MRLVEDIAEFLPFLASGAYVTLGVTGASLLIGLPLAFVGGLGRLSPNVAVRWAVGLYIEFFRGTSAIVQLFWVFFVLPLFGIGLEPFTAAVIALGLNVGAYGSEVVRAGIQSVPQGQTNAAIALNMTPFQRRFRIVLPQALPLMLPPFGNILIELLKGTSLVSLITLHDITFNAQLIRLATGRTVLIFSVVLVMYFVLARAITTGVRLMERRIRKRWSGLKGTMGAVAPRGHGTGVKVT